MEKKKIVFIFDEDKSFVKKIKEELEKGNFAVYCACEICAYDEAMTYFEADVIEPDIIIIGQCENGQELINDFQRKYPFAHLTLVLSQEQINNFHKNSYSYILRDPELIINVIRSQH